MYGRARPAREGKKKRWPGFARKERKREEEEAARGRRKEETEETKEKETGFARILKIFHFLLGKKKVEQRKPVPAALRAAGLHPYKIRIQYTVRGLAKRAPSGKNS